MPSTEARPRTLRLQPARRLPTRQRRAPSHRSALTGWRVTRQRDGTAPGSHRVAALPGPPPPKPRDQKRQPPRPAQPSSRPGEPSAQRRPGRRSRPRSRRTRFGWAAPPDHLVSPSDPLHVDTHLAHSPRQQNARGGLVLEALRSSRIWVNQLGGLTCEVGEHASRWFVKWTPPGRAHRPPKRLSEFPGSLRSAACPRRW
jgi:hypothetical protein